MNLHINLFYIGTNQLTLGKKLKHLLMSVYCQYNQSEIVGQAGTHFHPMLREGMHGIM